VRRVIVAAYPTNPLMSLFSLPLVAVAILVLFLVFVPFRCQDLECEIAEEIQNASVSSSARLLLLAAQMCGAYKPEVLPATSLDRAFKGLMKALMDRSRSTLRAIFYAFEIEHILEKHKLLDAVKTNAALQAMVARGQPRRKGRSGKGQPIHLPHNYVMLRNRLLETQFRDWDKHCKDRMGQLAAICMTPARLSFWNQHLFPDPTSTSKPLHFHITALYELNRQDASLRSLPRYANTDETLKSNDLECARRDELLREEVWLPTLRGQFKVHQVKALVSQRMEEHSPHRLSPAPQPLSVQSRQLPSDDLPMGHVQDAKPSPQSLSPKHASSTEASHSPQRSRRSDRLATKSHASAPSSMQSDDIDVQSLVTAADRKPQRHRSKYVPAEGHDTSAA
jgi:hypothetical protein